MKLHYFSCFGRGFPAKSCIAQPHDIIDLFHLGSQGIFNKSAPLYASGHSLREIATELGVCKSTIRQTLLNGGVDLRSCNGSPADVKERFERRHVGVAPYGFCVIHGRLIEDPKEQKNVQLILRLKSTGKSLSAIADHLNRQKIKTRKGGRWDHSIVRSIIQRHQFSQQSTEGK